MKFAARDTAAIDITCLVTGLVTVNGTEDSSWKHGMVPVSVRMVTGIEAAVLLSTVLDQKVLRRVKVRGGKIVSYYWQSAFQFIF